MFHGWWIVLSAVGIQVLVGALLMQSYGAYLVLLEADFGWSKTVLAAAFAMARLESGFLGPLQGWLIDRFGPRAVMRVGMLVFGAAFLMFSRIDSLLDFYLTFFLLALGSSLGGFASLTVAIVSWFDRHRAKAVAISQVGFAVGGLAVPLVVLSLESLGWRATAVGSGLLILAAGLPLTRIIEHRPEALGESVDGIADPAEPSRRAVAPDRSRDFTASEAMRTPAFWLISLGHASALLIVSAVMVHLVPHLHDGLGYPLSTAGWVVALMTAMQMVGQLCGGYLGDRYDKRVIVVVCMCAHAAGLLLVAVATSFSMVVGFAVLHGLAWGARGPLMVALRADYFGASSFGTIMGFSSLIVMLGMTAGPLVAGFFADRSGSYESGLVLLAFAGLAGSIFFILARQPRAGIRAPAPARRAATERSAG